MSTSGKSASYYEILEVSQNASQSVIRAAYKSLMQRYHPDKNPADPSMAQKAILIANAFEVLSDPKRRNAYDLELKQHDAINNNLSEAPSHLATSVISSEQSDLPSAPIVLGVIFLFALLAVVVQLSTKYEAVAQVQIQQTSVAIQPDESEKLVTSKAETKIKETESKVARTIPQFAKVIIVKMPPTKDGYSSCEIAPCTHYINIPTLGIIVYEKDFKKIIQHIHKNRNLIVEGIETELDKHLYTSLTKLDGEVTLKKIIRDQINMTIGGLDYSGTPLALESIGVEEVLLPDSFIIK